MSKHPWRLKQEGYSEISWLAAALYHLTDLDSFLSLFQLFHVVSLITFTWGPSVVGVYQGLSRPWFSHAFFGKRSWMGHIQDQLLLQFPELKASDGRKEENVFLAKLQFAVHPSPLFELISFTYPLSRFSMQAFTVDENFLSTFYVAKWLKSSDPEKRKL